MKTRAQIIETLQNFLLEEPSGSFALKHFGIDNYVLKRMAKFAREFDQTGEWTLIHLATLCKRQIEDTVCEVADILDNATLLDKYVECRQCINSSEVVSVRAELVGKMAAAIGMLTGGKLIGGAKAVDSEINDSIERIFEEFPKLRFESYLNSGQPIGELSATSIVVQSCTSLAECLLKLERSVDGIYVGYISNPGTIDGWFGFFVKSNGNLFSYNERINEAYVGQHRNMRNGRYAENKAFGLFPYELCNFSDDRDYKGYSREINIGENLKLLGNSEEGYGMVIRTFMAMALIAQKHKGQVIKTPPVFIDSLLPANIGKITMADTESSAIIPWEGSALIKATSKFAMPKFKLDKVLRGDYDKEFNGNVCGETGVFWGINQDIVDAYGAGFQIDQDKVLASNSSRRLIGDGGTEQEFVGTRRRLRLRAYYEVRKQLAAYIYNRMEADYSEFGNLDDLWEWYRAKLLDKMEKILQYCAEAHETLQDGEGRKDFGERERQSSPEPVENPFVVVEPPMRVCVATQRHYYRHWLCEDKDGSCICPVTGAKASYFFEFEFHNYKQVQRFLGCELPKFCIGWHAHRLYNGNSILDITDPVGNLTSPIHSFTFDFAIALSKRGLAKVHQPKADANT